MLDKMESKIMHKYKEGDQQRKNSLCWSASFGQVYLFCRLIKESVLEWFLLIVAAASLILEEDLKNSDQHNWGGET